MSSVIHVYRRTKADDDAARFQCCEMKHVPNSHTDKLYVGGRHNYAPPRPAGGDTTRYTSYTHMDPLLTRCPCWPASTANKRDLVTLTFDLESGVRVTRDVGYLCANFGIPRPRLRPDVRDRQTDVRQHRLMPPPNNDIVHSCDLHVEPAIAERTRICAAEMAVRYAALSECRKVHVCHCNSLGGAT